MLPLKTNCTSLSLITLVSIFAFYPCQNVVYGYVNDLIPEMASNEVTIEEGSGEFIMQGGKGNEEKSIKVYYHRPKNFQSQSKILIVIPGAGRNADSYRDAWIEESERYSILILSPMYLEREYGFGDYHLCGVIYDLDLKNSVEYVENSNVARLDENAFTFKVNMNADEWIFNDFDRLFAMAVGATNSQQTQYDVFGHSAGGQILHRFALFHPHSKAHRILACNSGFYTMPNFESALPFGLENTPLTKEDLKSSFQKHLILFNGELDNENETRGTLLRSVTVDQQGLHRLERGNSFYQAAKTMAKKMGWDFHWELQVVPQVGHNHKKIGDAAAEYLYGK